MEVPPVLRIVSHCSRVYGFMGARTADLVLHHFPRTVMTNALYIAWFRIRRGARPATL